jgi:hypothetical protein
MPSFSIQGREAGKYSVAAFTAFNSSGIKLIRKCPSRSLQSIAFVPAYDIERREGIEANDRPVRRSIWF